MSNATWEIDENIIFLRLGDGRVYIPRAQEIYDFTFNGKGSIKNVIPANELRSLDGINGFSRFPLEPVIELRANGALPGIVLDIKAEHEENVVYLDNFFTQTADHVVVNHVWFPILKGAIEELRTLLIHYGITQSGPIKLKQYLQIRFLPNYTIRDLTSGHMDAMQFAKSRSTERSGAVFTGHLYPYQKDGYYWLSYIDHQDMGCILADDMGLGKTIQVIALLADHAGSAHPSLIVAPATLLINWRMEIMKFAPGLTWIIHQGPQRTGFADELRQYDIVITSYDTIVRDKYMLKTIDWNLMILDEAQAIKNPAAKRTKAVKAVPRRSAIAMSGTPVQNRLIDLWSITDFVIPGLLGQLPSFEDKYTMDTASAKLLEPMISPIMLRRRLEEVAKDLPDKINIPQPLEMDPESSHEYEEIRLRTIEEYGNNATLVALTRMRMYCGHPSLISEKSGDPTEASVKYCRLLEILDEIFENNEKALIFTSWQKMTDILIRDISRRFGVYTNLIDGRVAINDRQFIVDEFNKVESPGILVLNPVAGGTGLNITGANHVIHYNLEWNPAVVDQATARAYRRGQKKPVTEHRLYYLDTVEEVISQRLKFKKKVADFAVVGVKGKDDDYEYVVDALRKSPIKKSIES